MALAWTLASTCLLAASTLATFMTMLHLRWRWDVTTSSVRWLFWYFFLWVFLWCLLRLVYYIHVLSLPELDFLEDGKGHVRTSSQLDRLGLYGLVLLEGLPQTWISVVLCVGDLALCGVALTLFPLTYELWRLAHKSMDRGAIKERAMIRRHGLVIGTGLVVYASVQVALVATYGGYESHTQRCLLIVYIIQFIGMVFMAGLLVSLKVNGRKYETIHGTFVESPVYQRLKLIMLTYCSHSFVFQLATLLIHVYEELPEGKLLNVVALSLLSYNASGLALSATTSCSQACIFSTCRHCFPEEFEADFQHHRLAGPKAEHVQAPATNPVFVYTDIESSTALWNLNSEAMTAATEIHDSILRTSLLKHRGYEITTVGDAFQIAFSSIRDAVEYSLDVQLQLLVARWPKAIEGMVPATKKQRSKGRVVFNGLRVRMGIHDASEQDGVLVQNIHMVTGRKFYSGMSEFVADFVSGLGSGGQILVTDRVASWLLHNRTTVSVDVFMDFVGSYMVPHINHAVTIYQLQPLMLAARAKHFPTPAHSNTTLNRQQSTGRLQLPRASSMALGLDAARSELDSPVQRTDSRSSVQTSELAQLVAYVDSPLSSEFSAVIKANSSKKFPAAHFWRPAEGPPS